MTRRSTDGGMTLLEIMIALAIVALLATLTAIGLGRVRKSDLRADAARLAAAMRSAFDRASATGAHHRVVLDLDKETFRVERCEGVVRLFRSVEAREAADAADLAARAEAAKATPVDMPGGIPAPPMPTVGSATCTPLPGELGQVVALHAARGIGIARVYVAHLERPAEEGEAQINFFPLGYAERAVVELTDDEDDVFSLVLHPLSGRVEVLPEKWRRPEDFVSEDAEGKSVR